jgi:hypothetical protein
LIWTRRREHLLQTDKLLIMQFLKWKISNCMNSQNLLRFSEKNHIFNGNDWQLHRMTDDETHNTSAESRI